MAESFANDITNGCNFLTASQRCCSPNVPMRIPAIFRELVVYRMFFPRELRWTGTPRTLVMLRLVSLACRICFVTIQIPQTLFQSQLIRCYITTRFGTVTKKMGIMTVLMLNRAWTLLSQRPSSSNIFSLVERPIDAIAKIIVGVRHESCDTFYIVCLRLRLAGVLLGLAIYLAFYTSRSFYHWIVPPKPLGGCYLARAAAWICGRCRSRKTRRYTILPIITVVLNAALVGRAYSSTRFLGACLDTGAASSRAGIAQAKALCNLTFAEWKMEPSTRKFRFGDVKSEPLGILTVPLTTLAGILNSRLHVVKGVPLLIGSDVLDTEQWYRNTRDLLVCEKGWSLPMSRSQGHYWLRHGLQPTSSTMFTKTQLYHLHRHFRHPGAAKMYELLRRTPEVDLPPNLFKMLQDIVKHCGSCQIFRSREITLSSCCNRDTS
jgi:hypothetical protein